jgi:hypothetical protein
MNVVSTIVVRRKKSNQVEVCTELAVDIVGRSVGTAEARSGRFLVEHDELTVQERSTLGFGQSLQGKIVLAESRHQQIALRLQHTQALSHPRMLLILREMSEYGKRVHEVERRIGI